MHAPGDPGIHRPLRQGVLAPLRSSFNCRHGPRHALPPDTTSHRALRAASCSADLWGNNPIESGFLRVFNAELRKSGQVPMTTPHAQAARNQQAARMVRAGRKADMEQQELTDDQGEPLRRFTASRCATSARGPARRATSKARTPCDRGVSGCRVQANRTPPSAESVDDSGQGRIEVGSGRLSVYGSVQGDFSAVRAVLDAVRTA